MVQARGSPSSDGAVPQALPISTSTGQKASAALPLIPAPLPKWRRPRGSTSSALPPLSRVNLPAKAGAQYQELRALLESTLESLRKTVFDKPPAPISCSRVELASRMRCRVQNKHAIRDLVPGWMCVPKRPVSIDHPILQRYKAAAGPLTPPLHRQTLASHYATAGFYKTPALIFPQQPKQKTADIEELFEMSEMNFQR